MSITPRIRRLFRLDRGQQDVARAVRDELDFHFDLTVQDLMARGASEHEARAEAERRFGDVERTRKGLEAIDRDRVARTSRIEWVSNVVQDVRYAVRGLRKRPGFSIGVVLILALGIGANATMFDIVDRLLFRAPAHLEKPGDVHRLYLATTVNGQEVFATSTSYRRYRELTDSTSSLSASAAFWNPTLAVGDGDPREVRVGFVTANFWNLFGVRPHLGRFFTAHEDQPPEGSRVAVLGYGHWQTAYGARTDVLGELIRIGKYQFTIVGVAPKDFSGVSSQPQVAFIPLSSGAFMMFPGNATNRWYSTYGLNWLQIVVRRESHVSEVVVTADLSRAFLRSYAAQRSERAATTVVESIAKPRAVVSSVLMERGPNRGSAAKVAIWLVGVALIVLTIACANVSNLLLARALQRRREIAVRLALGISRMRLGAQLLVESTVLALAGGLVGLAVAHWGGTMLHATLLPNVTRTNTLPDPRVLGFAVLVALAAGVLTGLAPAFHAGRSSLSAALKAGSREGTYQRSRLRTVLLVVQGALSVVLLVGAGLFVRSLNSVNDIRLGYEADNIAWVSLSMRGVPLDSARMVALRSELERTAATVPGVVSTAQGVSVPFYSDWEENLFVPGIDSVGRFGSFLTQSVTPEFFATMGTRIVRGRGISVDDQFGAPLAAVVSESMARTLWPGRDALGQCLKVRADTAPCTHVVGVAEDIKRTSLGNDPGLQYYLSHEQSNADQGELFIRTRGDAVASTELLRKALQRIMPGAAYVTVTPLSEVLGPVRRSWNLGATMFALFGVLALIVSGVGLYSVVSYSVSQRLQEMGVRIALGAQTADMVRLVLADSVAVSVSAILLGLGGALLASRWVKPLLFETSPYDPVVYGGVALILVVVAVLAGIVPALRASHVSPTEALKAD